MKNTILIFLICCLLLFMFCGKGSQGKSSPTVEVIDGVEYVHNTGIPLHPGKTVEFEEELIIGNEEAEGKEIHLFQPHNFTVNNYGDFYIGDASDNAIKMYDKNGNFIKSFGRKGQGPGEFSYIYKMTFLKDGRLIITDPDNTRINFFNNNGEFLESIKFEERGYFFSFYLITNVTLTCGQSVHGDKKRNFIKTFTFDGTETVNFGEFVKHEGREIEPGHGVWFPFDPYSIFTGDNERQRLYHCMTDEFLIEVYNKEGKLFRKIDRPYEKVPVSGKEIDEYISVFERPGNEKTVKLLRNLDYPEFMPVAESMIVDDAGNLWIETNEKKMENDIELTACDIFNPKGYYEARVWLEFEPELFKNGKMYQKHRDEETGLTTIKRYNVKWVKE